MKPQSNSYCPFRMLSSSSSFVGHGGVIALEPSDYSDDYLLIVSHELT